MSNKLIGILGMIILFLVSRLLGLGDLFYKLMLLADKYAGILMDSLAKLANLAH